MDALIAHDRAARNNDDRQDLECDRDHWQPIGVVAKRLIQRLGVPPSTGVILLERAGIQVEAD